MSETVPLEFEAIDRLTSTVDKMVQSIEALVAAQTESTKATEENAEAQDDAASSLGKMDKVLAIARNGVELAGMVWEKVSGIYEGLVAAVDTSLSKWDEQAKRTGVAASALGSVADASARAEKAQDKVFRSIGKVIEQTGLAQIAFNAKKTALDELNKFIKTYDDDIVKTAQDLGGGFLSAVRDVTKFIDENAASFAGLIVLGKNLQTLLSAVYEAFTILAQYLKLQFYTALALVSTALLKLVEGLQWVIKTAGGEVPQAIEDMRLGLEALSNTTKDRAIKTLGDMVDTADRATAKITKFGTSLYDAFTGKDSQLSDAEKNVKSFTTALQNRIKELEDQLAKARGGGTGKAKLGEEAKEAARQTQLLEIQNKIVDSRAAGTAELTIELEKQLAILEAEQSTVGMISRRQKELTKLVGTKTAELDAAEKLKALSEEEAAKAEERAAAQQAVMDKALAASQVLVSLDAERLNLEARRLRIAGGEGSELKAVELERQAQLLQLSTELESIENDEIRARTEKIRLQAIELDYQEKLTAAQEETLAGIDAIGASVESSFGDVGGLLSESLAADLEGWQSRIDANDEYMEKLDELGRLDEKTKKRMTEENEKIAEEMDKVTKATERQIAAFERGAQAAAMLGTNIAKISVNNKSLAESQGEVSAALGASVNLAGSIVSAFTDNVKTRAKWEAAFNAAAAIAAGALSFANPAYIPVAAGHAAAAVKFGLVASGAIGAGGGGGGGVPSGGGGAVPPANNVSLDLERERVLTAESIAESIASQGRGGGTTIVIDFGSSLIASTSPQAAQELADLLEPELQRRIR